MSSPVRDAAGQVRCFTSHDERKKTLIHLVFCFSAHPLLTVSLKGDTV